MARYTNEMRERSVRMVVEVRLEHPHETAALRHVAGLLGMNVETLRLWVHRAQVDAGHVRGRRRRTSRRSCRIFGLLSAIDIGLERHLLVGLFALVSAADYCWSAPLLGSFGSASSSVDT